MKLYSYWRSSAAYRVRIALNLKNLDCDIQPISLIDGEQRNLEYLGINPQGLVPFLEDGDVSIGQSLAILEYLEEQYPQPPLLPDDRIGRALARQIAGIIASDIHPLCNLRVLDYLKDALVADEPARQRWYAHWVSAGLAAVEAILERSGSERFCVGGAPTMADACLIPQVYNARRFEIPLDDYPRIGGIDAHCRTLKAFSHAAPDKQTG